MPKKFEVRSIIICDDIRAEANGKQQIFGIYDDEILAASIPVLMPKLCIRIAIVLPGSNPTKLKFEVRPASGGDAVFEHTGKMGSNKAPLIGGVRKYALVFAMQPGFFPKVGKYNISLGLDGPLRVIGEFESRLPRNDAEKSFLPKQT